MRKELAIRILQYVLGAVVFIQSVMVAVNFETVAHGSHIAMPAHFVLVLAVVEALGALLFMLPWALKVGGWVLIAVFSVAVLVHIVHGQFEGLGLLIYGAAVLAVMHNPRGD
jgi:uncharacterized membrane protein YphA (DoxX/SURF4 family)